jgi:hypothetical protein
MSTLHLHFNALIKGSPKIIFDLIADLPNYNLWLPASDSFGATTQVSPYPVRLGTTYLDAGKAGLRPGSVTGYDPPKHIAFHHTMMLKRGPIDANVDAHIRYTIEAVESATSVIRDLGLTIKIRGFWKIAKPLVVRGFRKENVRILAALKRYVEALSQLS